MHYQDFNQAGDQKLKFNPMDLVQPNMMSDEDTKSRTYYSQNEDDENDIDDFTKKRLPKMEDFILPEEKPKRKKKPKTTSPPGLIDEFQEKILSLKN